MSGGLTALNLCISEKVECTQWEKRIGFLMSKRVEGLVALAPGG